MKTIIEPFRMKVIEPIRMSTRAARNLSLEADLRRAPTPRRGYVTAMSTAGRIWLSLWRTSCPGCVTKP